MSAVPKLVVANIAEGEVAGDDWPLIPDAVYLARYVKHECVELRQFKNQPKVFVVFEIVEPGPHHGKRVFRAYRVRRRIDSVRFVANRRSDLLKMICRVEELKVRPDRISLRALRRYLLRIRTRTVTRDRDQKDLPVAMQYSVVADILGKEVG